MKLYNSLPLICVLFMFCAGCSPSGQVHVTRITPGPPAVMPAAIETFDAQEPPERPFREIAALTYSGVLGDYPDVVRQFKIKARELGANAIILEDPVTYTGERHPYEHMLFRATAIAYQDRGATASR